MSRSTPANRATERVAIADLPGRVRAVAQAYAARDEQATRQALRQLARDAAFLAARDPLRFPLPDTRTVTRHQEIKLATKQGGFFG